MTLDAYVRVMVIASVAPCLGGCGAGLASLSRAQVIGGVEPGPRTQAETRIANGVYLVELDARNFPDLDSLDVAGHCLEVTGCRILSTSSDNSLFTADFTTRPFPSKDSSRVVLHVNGKTYCVDSCAGAHGTLWSVTFTKLDQAAAEQIAEWQSVEPRLRRDEPPRLRFRLFPFKQRHKVGGRIKVGVWLTNEEDAAVSFEWGVVGPGCLNTRIEFWATTDDSGAALNPRRKPPGYSVRSITLGPKGTLKQSMDLGDWLAFDKAGVYVVRGRYQVRFHGPVGKGQVRPDDGFIHSESSLETECTIMVD